MASLVYVSHPDVLVDPEVDAPQWGLTDIGRARVRAMLHQPWVSSVQAIVSSAETKALETASILASHRRLAPEVVESQERVVDAFASCLARVRSGTTVAAIGDGGVGTRLICSLTGTGPSSAFDRQGQGQYWVWDGPAARLRHRWRPIDIVIADDRPHAADVVELLRAHLDFARATSPPEHVHALDLDGLATPDISFFSARRDHRLLAVGALRDLGDGRAEIKSMHTAATTRGLGVGRLMLDHLIDTAVETGRHWIGLETGTQDAFAPARRLYAAAGFEPCTPFDEYTVNPYSVCMSRPLPRTSVGT